MTDDTDFIIRMLLNSRINPHTNNRGRG